MRSTGAYALESTVNIFGGCFFLNRTELKYLVFMLARVRSQVSNDEGFESLGKQYLMLLLFMSCRLMSATPELS
jgi:hypothetical protein